MAVTYEKYIKDLVKPLDTTAKDLAKDIRKDLPCECSTSTCPTCLAAEAADAIGDHLKDVNKAAKTKMEKAERKVALAEKKKDRETEELSTATTELTTAETELADLQDYQP